MRHFWLSPLVFLAVLPLAGFTAPVEPWDDMRVMHTWHTVPVNWESLGHPSVGTTLNLYIALKPYRESALTDALDEISNPRHPRHALFRHSSAPRAFIHACRRSVLDMAHIFLRRRLLNLLILTLTRSR